MFYGMNLNPKCTFAACNKMPAFYLCGKFLVGKGIITMKLKTQSALWFDSDWSVVYWPIWCPCSSLYAKKSKTTVGSPLLSLAVYFSEDQLVSFKTLKLLTVISVHRFFCVSPILWNWNLTVSLLLICKWDCKWDCQCLFAFLSTRNLMILSECYKFCFCFQPSWRKPKGIDNRVRRRFKGQYLMPSIGYGSNKKTRHLMPDGFKKFVIHNVQVRTEIYIKEFSGKRTI